MKLYRGIKVNENTTSQKRRNKLTYESYYELGLVDGMNEITTAVYETLYNTLSQRFGIEWEHPQGFDGHFCFIDEKNPNIIRFTFTEDELNYPVSNIRQYIKTIMSRQFPEVDYDMSDIYFGRGSLAYKSPKFDLEIF